MRSELFNNLWAFVRAVRPPLSNRSDGGVHLLETANESGSFRLADVQWLDAPECPSLVQGACGPHDTSDQHNTHIVEVREVRYPWHPWCGRKVKVHAMLVKHGIGVARCSSEDVHPHRLLELPLWMLDSTVCGKIRVAKPGSVNVESLRELKYLLDLVQSASGELAKEIEHQYFLNAGGADVNVAESQASRSTPAVCMPSFETTDESVMGGSVDRCSSKDGAVARATPPASLHQVPRRGSGRGGGR